MIDLSFSSYNFETIFDIECRKRDMKDYMPEEYSIVVDEISLYNKELRTLKEKKYKSLTVVEKNRIEVLEGQLDDAQKSKNSIQEKALNCYSKLINSKSFSITLDEVDRSEGIYSFNTDSPELFFLSKKLQHNLRKVFEVKQSDRHLVLSQLKLLLNEDTPRCIIKIDITKFYESIPQSKLLKLIFDNRSLDAKSKSLIKAVIENYELMKDKTIFKEGCGVPRGIGISAYLSEIYMAELDCYIRNYEGVIYYARYVDDIIIIMHKNVDSLSPSMIHSALDKEFYRYDLKLQAKSHSKTSLFDLTVPTLTAPLPKVMNYLGYRINLYRCNGSTTTKYGISDNKKKKVKDRISKSIDYFNFESKYNISRAKDVLFACLKLLSSNLKLSGSKSRVKAGIYYSNNLLDNTNEIEEFDAILSDELTKLNPHDGLFSSTAAKEAFIMRLKKQIVSVANFKRGFDTKRIYKINSETRKVIMKIWQ